MPMCELCRRELSITPITKHHLIPRAKHKAEFKKGKTREELSAGIMICRPCHNHIHKLWSEKQLAEKFNTIEMLKSDSRLTNFVEWIASKEDGFKPKKSGVSK